MKRALATAIVLGFIVGACGGGGDGSDVETPGPTAGPSDESPAPVTDRPDVVAPTETEPPHVTETQSPPTTEAPTGPPELPAYAKEIQARGVVRVGVQNNDFPPFMSYDPAQDLYVGFEGTMARLLVAGTIGPIDVEYVPLTGGERFAALDNGDVDFVVRMTTNTPERRLQANFTTPYLMAGVAAIVPADSEINEIADLRDSRLAVRGGSPMRTLVGDKLAELGMPFESLQLGEALDPWEAVLAGGADGYIDSWAVGINRAFTQGDVKVIPVVFTEGIAAFTALDRPEWAALLDQRLKIIIEAGVWVEDFEATFGFPPPWTVEEMAAAG